MSNSSPDQGSADRIQYVIQETPDYSDAWQNEPGQQIFNSLKAAQQALSRQLNSEPNHAFHFSHRIRRIS
jgi:predicted NAD/FAD-dependent oxidoreductase